MGKYVGIDASEHAVHIVEIDGSYKKARLVRCRVEELDATVAPAEHTIEAAAAAARAMKEARMSGAEVLGHPCFDAVLRKITLPFSGRDAIRKVVKSEVENTIHSHAIDDMIVDFHELGANEDGTRVLVAAVPKVGLRSMVTSLEQEGIEPERVELDTMALYRVADWAGALSPQQERSASDGVEDLPSGESASLTAVLDLGPRATRVLLVADGKLVDMRTVRLGDATVADAVARQHQLSFADARDAVAQVLAGEGDFQLSLPAPGDESGSAGEGDEGEPSEEAAELPARAVCVTRGEVQDAQTHYLQRLARELVRFLTAAGVDGRFDSVWVAGAACRGEGMLEMLSEVFGVAPQELDVLSRLRHSLSDEEAEALSPRIATAVGLALTDMGGPEGFQLRQEDLAYTRGFDRIKFPLAIACMVAVFASIVYWVKLGHELEAVHYRMGQTFTGEGADPDNPRFFGHVNSVLGTGFFDEPRYFEYRTNDQRYGWKELREELQKTPVEKRVRLIRDRLKRVLAQKQEESGIYEDVKLESGLAVIERLLQVLKRAEPSLGKYGLCTLELDMHANRAGADSGRSLKFTIAVRGSNFRERFAALRTMLEEDCRAEGSPFSGLSATTGGERLFKDSAETGVEGAYNTYELLIPSVFDPFRVGQ